jgi:tetratricopeptide (TPR) repeat protein
VEFRILGPLEISAGSERLELGGARQQIVVATLLLSPNRAVTVDRLVEAIYGEDPPSTARLQVQISISSLRRLFASHGRAAVIATRPHGYEIGVGGGELDAQRFAQLVAVAAKAREAGQLASAELDRGQRDAARELLSEALALSRLTGHKRFEAQVLYRLGEAALLAGELDDAAEAFRSALLLVRDIGDLVGEAYALRGTGVTQVRQGELGPARKALRHAIDLAVVTGDPLIQAQALRGLGEAALAGGDPGQAIMYAEQAAGLSRSISAALEERRALALLDDAQAAHGEAQT